MERIKLLWKLLKFRFTAPFTRDQHFNKTLRNFFVLGFYQKFTRVRAISSFVITVLVFSTVFIGTSFRLIKALNDRNLGDSLSIVMFLLRQSIIISELVSFHAKKMKIRKMIRYFHELANVKGGEDREKLFDRIIKAFNGVYVANMLVLYLVVNVLIYDKVHFFIPVVYEAADKYSWFSFMYFVYFLHCVVFITIVISIDVLPIISVLKLEGLVASLRRKMEEMTSGDLRENEQKLDDCIKFHVKVLK
jgi:hypothetical protein